jgi:hypothetical protein
LPSSLPRFFLSGACRKAADPGRQPVALSGASSPGRALDTIQRAPARSLLSSLQSELQRVNPSITFVEVYDIEHISITDSTRYILVALGHGIHRGWKDSSQVGEIFGVFGIDSALSHVTRVYDMFPTPRMSNYELFFAHSPVTDSIVLVGKGATYGDEPMRRTYPRWP